jgi:hypothetical protein
VRRVLAFTVVAVALLAACGGDSDSPSSTPDTTSRPAVNVAAGDPSAEAKMICETQAITAINRVVGVDAKVSKPAWDDAIYDCDYDYPDDAAMNLSVKQLATPAEVTAYYDKLADDLGKKEDLEGRGFTIGQGAFTTDNGSVVTRKDNFVLLVDVSDLPLEFGAPPDTRENVAINTAVTVMECWV